ncbi:uncharacterized protein NECHADRAFT_85164 [Fusarium vanettenii 77-13-4]|uniref:Uncharacterized protein n=1 Tax=Fusarium vanettenii (strain ATCC MYA-4622 / CBS 123669 / FGSC 9596 / NRRL 45880 / 77-13-4) TaxID=660122 RepID=C7YV62_FUSV7|nr:uncharacterized protein NECHADRAFT_85164 [Fusarium vanettenii 77-13-4]EEU44525.1 predicted protein [Fusarium vanettenii 77-13-4]
MLSESFVGHVARADMHLPHFWQRSHETCVNNTERAITRLPPASLCLTTKRCWTSSWLVTTKASTLAFAEVKNSDIDEGSLVGLAQGLRQAQEAAYNAGFRDGLDDAHEYA